MLSWKIAARTREDAAQGLSLERGRVSLPRAALALALCGESNQVDPLIDELKQRYPEDYRDQLHLAADDSRCFTSEWVNTRWHLRLRGGSNRPITNHD